MSITDTQSPELARARRIVTNPDQYAPAVIASAFTRLRMDHEARRIAKPNKRGYFWPIIPGGVA